MSRVNGRVIEGPRVDKIELSGVPIVVPAGGSAGAERGGEELLRCLDLVVEVRVFFLFRNDGWQCSAGYDVLRLITSYFWVVLIG